MAETNPADSKYDFQATPFPATPQAESFCEIGSMGEAHQRITRAIARAEGPAIIVGGPGLGKSLLCNRIATDCQADCQVVPIAEGSIDSSRDLLQAILFELQLPYREQEEGEMRLALMDHLRPGGKGTAEGVLLIVDEAQALSTELLEEIRMISSIVRSGRPRVRTVLAGGPRLDETLADPRLASFAQRIAARCYLHSLTSSETVEYVRQQLERVGADPDGLIDSAAISRVHHASDGIPRLINQLMSHVLYNAAQEAVDRIDADLVQRAWADLQQLPMPTPAKTTVADSSNSDIEFGSLDDDDSSAIEFGELSDGPAQEHASECSEKSCDESALEESVCEESVCEESVCEESEAAEIFQSCVGIPTSDSAEEYTTQADSGLASVGADHLAEACGCESAFCPAETFNAASMDTAVCATVAEDYNVADQGNNNPSHPCDPAPTASTKLARTDFTDFPVVRLGGSNDARQPEPSKESTELEPETVCFEQQMGLAQETAAVKEASIKLELDNVTEEPVTNEAAFGSIDDSVWSASQLSLADVAAITGARQPAAQSSDPFGDGFDEEEPIDLNRPATIDRQPAPQWLLDDSDDSDELEESLRREVISINQDAMQTEPVSIGQYHHDGLSISGHGAHKPARAIGDMSITDDRDLLIVEDEVADVQIEVPRSANPQAERTMDDLTNLFSRIRQG